jgi:hypothetical protein
MRHDIPGHPHGSRSKDPSLCGRARGVSQSFVSPVFGFSNPNPPAGEDVEIGPATDCATGGNSEVEELVMIMRANTDGPHHPRILFSLVFS